MFGDGLAYVFCLVYFIFFCKQKTAYEMRISDWSSDVCSSDLIVGKPTGTSRDGHVFVSGPTLSCLSEGSAGGTRTAAWCTSPIEGDVSCAMVATGTVLRWRRSWRGHRCPGSPGGR